MGLGTFRGGGSRQLAVEGAPQVAGGAEGVPGEEPQTDLEVAALLEVAVVDHVLLTHVVGGSVPVRSKRAALVTSYRFTLDTTTIKRLILIEKLFYRGKMQQKNYEGIEQAFFKAAAIIKR